MQMVLVLWAKLNILVVVQLLSGVRLFAAPWTVAHQASLSMEFSWLEYWSGLPFPSVWDLPYPGIELRSPALQEDSLLTESLEKPTEQLKFSFYRSYSQPALPRSLRVYVDASGTNSEG